MDDRRIAGKAIVLGLAVTHLGPSVIAQETATEAINSNTGDLSGLIAADTQNVTDDENSGNSIRGGCPTTPDLAFDTFLPPERPLFVNESFSISFWGTDANNNSDCAPDREVTFSLPPEVDFVGSSGCFATTEQSVTCQLGSAPSPLAFLGSVDLVAAEPGRIVQITGTVSTSAPETNLDNNTARGSIEIIGAEVPVLSNTGKWLIALLMPLLAFFSLRRK